MSHVRRELDRRTLHYCNKTWVRLPAHATNVSQIYFWHLVLAAFSFSFSHGWCIKFLVDKTKNVSVLTRQDTSLSGKYHPPSLSLFWSQGVCKNLRTSVFKTNPQTNTNLSHLHREKPNHQGYLKCILPHLSSVSCCWCPCGPCGRGPVSAPAGGPGPRWLMGQHLLPPPIIRCQNISHPQQGIHLKQCHHNTSVLYSKSHFPHRSLR